MDPATPQAKELRPFVPSGPDYPLTLAFYRELGFAVEWESPDLAVLALGPCRFYLQRLDDAHVLANYMLYLMVDNLDSWWDKIRSAGFEGRYPGFKARPPEVFPWGIREVHFIAPGGVCWHLAQSG